MALKYTFLSKKGGSYVRYFKNKKQMNKAIAKGKRKTINKELSKTGNRAFRMFMRKIR